MKCPHCYGNGEVIEESDNGIGWISKKCRWCNGTGEKVITWEQKIRTCSRRELAELIYKMCNFDCIIDSACNPETPDYRESVNEAYEWLQTECKYEL